MATTEVPENRRYTVRHQWLLRTDGSGTVGITAHGVGLLGDIVYLRLPEAGERVATGQPCGEIETVDSVHDLHAPAAGVVLEVNSVAVHFPELVNLDPYGDGWLFRSTVDDEPDLLSSKQYQHQVESTG